MSAGLIALRSRKARFVTELVRQGIKRRRVAEVTADLLVDYGISFRQLTARNPGDQTRKLCNQALRIAEEIVAREG